MSEREEPVKTIKPIIIKQDSFLVGFLAGGTGSSIAEIITLPLDTAKVRMQIYGMSGKYRSVSSTLQTMKSELGFLSLWRSLTPACTRQFLFSGIKLSIYEPLRNMLWANKEEMMQTPTYKKIMAGVISGGLACCMVSPIDLVQTRIQDSEFKKRYKGIPDWIKQIYKANGFTGFFRGVGLNLIRNSVMNAAELGTYDTWRQYILYNTNLSDATWLYLFYGIAAGFVSAIVTQPIDILKTRVMNNPEIYKDGWTCFKITLQRDGILQFYSGLRPFMVRATWFNAFFFLGYGYWRKFFGHLIDD